MRPTYCGPKQTGTFGPALFGWWLMYPNLFRISFRWEEKPLGRWWPDLWTLWEPATITWFRR